MKVAQAGLQLEQAPPFWVPLAFFLAAPLFALLAAILLAWEGPDALGSRWTPAALSVTHLLTLGFMAMAMLGSMMQILPVLAGAPMPWPRSTGAITHASVALGTLLLAAGLWWPSAALMGWALPLLGIGFTLFLASATLGLALAPSRSAIASDFWLVAIALAVAVVFGTALGAPRAWEGVAVPASLFDLHPGWALLGWTGLLIAAVAKQVVPMFQITPPYPRAAERFLTASVFALLVLWTIAAAAFPHYPAAGAAFGLGLAAVYAFFALATLDLQRRRRRRLADVTLNFWRLGMASLAVCSVLWSVRLLGWASEDAAPSLDATLGTLAIVGAAMSLINGMLYKILPFLAWFHLSARGGGRGMHMHSFLATSAQKRQFVVHLGAVLLLAGAAGGAVVLFYPGAVCLGISALMLASNSIRVLAVYRVACRTAAAAAGASAIKPDSRVSPASR